MIPKISNVEEFMDSHSHPLKEVLISLRKFMLNIHPLIGEQIKWNCPSYFYLGEMEKFDSKTYKRDVVVFNIRKDDFVLLIFPSANHVPVQIELEEENLSDGRKMIKIFSQNDLESKEKYLEKLIMAWIESIDR